MKILKPLAILALATVVVGPYFVGLYLENKNDEALEKIASQYPQISFTATEYKRGWFTTKARFLAEIPTPAAGEEDSTEALPSFEFVSTTHHGPLPFTALKDGNFGFKPALALSDVQLDLSKFAANRPKELEHYANPRVVGHVTFFGTFKYQCEVEGGQFTTDADTEVEPVTISWSPVECTGDNKMSDNTGQLTSNLAAFSLKSASTDFALSNARMDYDINRFVGDIALADVNAAIENITFNGDDGMALALKNLSISGGSDVDSHDHLTGTVEYAVDSVQVVDFEMHNAKINLGFADVDIATVQALQTRMQSIAKEAQQLTQQPDIDDEAAQALGEDVVAVYQQMLPQLLNGASVSINALQADLPQGSLRVNGSASLGEFDVEQITSPLQLLGLLQATITASAAEPLLDMAIGMAAMQQMSQLPDDMPPEQRMQLMTMIGQQTEGMIEGFVEAGFLELNNGVYKTTAAFKDMSLSFNGKPFEMPFGAMVQ